MKVKLLCLFISLSATTRHSKCFNVYISGSFFNDKLRTSTEFNFALSYHYHVSFTQIYTKRTFCCLFYFHHFIGLYISTYTMFIYCSSLTLNDGRLVNLTDRWMMWLSYVTFSTWRPVPVLGWHQQYLMMKNNKLLTYQ